MRSLDSVGGLYNSQITVHVGYAITVTAVVVTGLLALFSFIEQIIRDWALACIRSDATFLAIVLETIATVPFFISLFVAYFFGYWPWPRFVSFTYLFGRIRYYMALSQLVWEHMGISVGTGDVSVFYTLKERAVGKEGKGIDEAIISLFEARLSVSLWHRRHPGLTLSGDPRTLSDELLELRKRLQAELESAEVLRVVSANICDVSRAYYEQRAPLWGRRNLADLLHLAYSPALEGSRKGSREIIEGLGETDEARSSTQVKAVSHRSLCFNK